MADTQEAGSEQKNAQQFALQRIYIKDLSFESPLGAKVFTKQWKPQIKVDLNTRSDRVNDENFEVVLTITITAKLEEETAFLVEVQQGGVFFVQGVEGEALRRLLSVVCPTILFPYARETIDSLVTRGSFPALMLQPVNFEALYLQALKQSEEQAQAAATTQ
ncbi:MAG: protein-export chaperone SecB [Spongiibacteraceae bacterium]|jgi:preprotein translocase subunit SecB|nr:protein-export chaperone SecB [Spongiibacteraceae bacterium]